MLSFLERFRIDSEREDFHTIRTVIEAGLIFRGTNLWILVFAIFIASMGLNVNSTAVIIGAMLVSPLMGPIMGLGLSIATHDYFLLRRSLNNYLFATAISLITSTIYFLVTPLNNAHSEILARTYPTVYDVLIALFGGLAGSLAFSSRQKGNVIPGVAIATALMPPLCTAGYGLAVLNYSYLFGALYLYLINTVFIGLATFFTARFLKFPLSQIIEKERESQLRRLVFLIAVCTLLPSVYLAFHIVKEEQYMKEAQRFIQKEVFIPNNYLLEKKIDYNSRSVELIFGGELISKATQDSIRKKFSLYPHLAGTSLKINQGFAYIKDDSTQRTGVDRMMHQMAFELIKIRKERDSLQETISLSESLFKELKEMQPRIASVQMSSEIAVTDSTSGSKLKVVLGLSGSVPQSERRKIEQWLKVKMDSIPHSIHFTRL